jgi:transcriptional pleiotropic regulator of transition state genes
MKATGIVRCIDNLGRVVIPKELRRTLGINEFDPLEIFVDGQNVVLRKYVPVDACVVCGDVNRTITIESKPFCERCVGLVAAAHAHQQKVVRK